MSWFRIRGGTPWNSSVARAERHAGFSRDALLGTGQMSSFSDGRFASPVEASNESTHRAI